MSLVTGAIMHINTDPELESQYSKYPELEVYTEKIRTLEHDLGKLSGAVLSRHQELNETRERASTLLRECEDIEERIEESLEKYDSASSDLKELSEKNEGAATAINNASRGALDLLFSRDTFKLFESSMLFRRRMRQLDVNQEVADKAAKITDLTGEVLAITKTIQELQISRFEKGSENEIVEKEARRINKAYLELKWEEVSSMIELGKIMDQRRHKYWQFIKGESAAAHEIEILLNSNSIKDEVIGELSTAVTDLQDTNTKLRRLREASQNFEEGVQDSIITATRVTLHRRELERSANDRSYKMQRTIRHGNKTINFGGSMILAFEFLSQITRTGKHSVRSEEEMLWYINDFGIDPKYAWTVIRNAGRRWQILLEWHSAVKLFCTRTGIYFGQCEFKRSFEIAKSRALSWVGESSSKHDIDGNIYSAKEVIPGDMWDFFHDDDEGVNLFTLLESDYCKFQQSTSPAVDELARKEEGITALNRKITNLVEQLSHIKTNDNDAEFKVVDAILARQRELCKENVDRDDTAIRSGNKVAHYGNALAHAARICNRHPHDPDLLMWFEEIFVMRTHCVENVLKFASSEWITICDWYNGVKHFHCSVNPNSSSVFREFGRSFHMARVKAFEFVKQSRGDDWATSEIPQEMKQYFTASEEGVALYARLRSEHDRGEKHHLEERNKLNQKRSGLGC